MKLYCLHGFLGLPRDWDTLAAALAKSLPGFDSPGAVVKADLFGKDYFPEAGTMPDWAETYYQQEMQADAAGPRASGNYLLGYSLGGRLALHLAVQCPNFWDGVIIIGANPGLESEEARGARRQNDEIWARRFETEHWDSVVAAWDAQPVFAGRSSAAGERREADYSRVRLAGALRRWSLGAQCPLWDALTSLRCPMLWIAGADDAGQVPICRRIQETVPNVDVWVAADAGHRVPWEQPGAFTESVLKFLETTQSQLENRGEL